LNLKYFTGITLLINYIFLNFSRNIKKKNLASQLFVKKKNSPFGELFLALEAKKNLGFAKNLASQLFVKKKNSPFGELFLALEASKPDSVLDNHLSRPSTSELGKASSNVPVGGCSGGDCPFHSRYFFFEIARLVSVALGFC